MKTLIQPIPLSAWQLRQTSRDVVSEVDRLLDSHTRAEIVTILNAKEDPGLQIEQISDMIAKQVDAVCLVPMKEEPLVRGVQMLNKAKIHVIIVNRQIGRDCDYVCDTGTDTYAGAAVSAKILVEAMGYSGQLIEFHQHPLPLT